MSLSIYFITAYVATCGWCDCVFFVSPSKLARSEKVQLIKDILSDMYLQPDEKDAGLQCGKKIFHVCMHMPRQIVNRSHRNTCRFQVTLLEMETQGNVLMQAVRIRTQWQVMMQVRMRFLLMQQTRRRFLLMRQTRRRFLLMRQTRMRFLLMQQTRIRLLLMKAARMRFLLMKAACLLTLLLLMVLTLRLWPMLWLLGVVWKGRQLTACLLYPCGRPTPMFQSRHWKDGQPSIRTVLLVLSI